MIKGHFTCTLHSYRRQIHKIEINRYEISLQVKSPPAKVSCCFKIKIFSCSIVRCFRWNGNRCLFFTRILLLPVRIENEIQRHWSQSVAANVCQFWVHFQCCIRAKRPFRRRLSPVSVAWSDWEYFSSPLDAILVHHRATPSFKFAGTGIPIYTPGWREALWECLSQVSYPRKQRNLLIQCRNPDRAIRRRAHQPWDHPASHKREF